MRGCLKGFIIGSGYRLRGCVVCCKGVLLVADQKGVLCVTRVCVSSRSRGCVVLPETRSKARECLACAG